MVKKVAGYESAHYQGWRTLPDARNQSAHYQGASPQPDAAYQRHANTYRGRVHLRGTFREHNPQVYRNPRDLPEEGEEVKGDGGPKSPYPGKTRRTPTRSLAKVPPGGDRKRDRKHGDKWSQE